MSVFCSSGSKLEYVFRAIPFMVSIKPRHSLQSTFIPHMPKPFESNGAMLRALRAFLRHYKTFFKHVSQVPDSQKVAIFETDPVISHQWHAFVKKLYATKFMVYGKDEPEKNQGLEEYSAVKWALIQQREFTKMSNFNVRQRLAYLHEDSQMHALLLHFQQL